MRCRISGTWSCDRPRYPALASSRHKMGRRRVWAWEHLDVNGKTARSAYHGLAGTKYLADSIFRLTRSILTKRTKRRQQFLPYTPPHPKRQESPWLLPHRESPKRRPALDEFGNELKLGDQVTIEAEVRSRLRRHGRYAARILARRWSKWCMIPAAAGPCASVPTVRRTRRVCRRVAECNGAVWVWHLECQPARLATPSRVWICLAGWLCAHMGRLGRDRLLGVRHAPFVPPRTRGSRLESIPELKLVAAVVTDGRSRPSGYVVWQKGQLAHDGRYLHPRVVHGPDPCNNVAFGKRQRRGLPGGRGESAVRVASGANSIPPRCPAGHYLSNRCSPTGGL
jgi:hypothetical protein